MTNSKDELQDLAGLIDGHKEAIRALKIIGGETYYTQQLASIDGIISEQQAKRERLVRRHENGPKLIADLETAIVEVRKKIVRVRNRKRYEKLAELKAAIESLEGEVSLDEIKLMMESDNDDSIVD